MPARAAAMTPTRPKPNSARPAARRSTARRRARAAAANAKSPTSTPMAFARSAASRPPRPSSPPELEQALDAALAIASDKGRRHPTNQDFGLVARRADGAASDRHRRRRLGLRQSRSVFARRGEGGGEGVSQERRGRRVAIGRGRRARCSRRPTRSSQRRSPRGSTTAPPRLSSIALARENAASGALDVGVAWVGDSRAYLVAANVPETLLTRDDSWAHGQNRVRRAFARRGDAFALRARHHAMARHAALEIWLFTPKTPFSPAA